MKILLYDDTQAYLTHGGKQVHAQKMYENLHALGVDIEYARWWDPSQKCDLIHSLGCSPGIVWAAKQAGVKLVLTHIVDVTSYSWISQIYREYRNQMIRNLRSERIGSLFQWYDLPSYDALVYLQKYDLEAAIKVYGVAREKTCVVSNGCDADVIKRLQLGPINAKSYLVCMASILPVKNCVLLAKAARIANVPVVFLGKPFNENDTYYLEFQKLIDGKYVIYPGYVSGEEKNHWLTEASGFVLLSKHESGSLAILEAAAAGLPLLLSNLKWAYAYEKNSSIQYVDLNNEIVIGKTLRSFFDSSKRIEGFTFPVISWKEVAEKYVDIYTKVLSRNVKI